MRAYSPIILKSKRRPMAFWLLMKRTCRITAGWAKGGKWAGAQGMGKRLEAVEAVVLPTGRWSAATMPQMPHSLLAS